RWPFVLLPRVRRRLTCPRLPYATLFRSPAVPVAAGLARRASIGRGYGSGAPSRPSGGAYVFIGTALQRHEPHGLATAAAQAQLRSEEHTSELQSRENRVCRLLREKTQHA